MDWNKLLNKARPRKSTSQGDQRAEFERDFDRAVFSTPVRRLQDKAQVFPLDPNDAGRTRLTHSLEVSSVARGLATGVGKWLLAEKLIEKGLDRSIEAIAATCGLIHDLGNPPFGHSGEDAIREWFRDKSGEKGLRDQLGDRPQAIHDFLKFEGNAQSLRLVAKLQILADYKWAELHLRDAVRLLQIHSAVSYVRSQGGESCDQEARLFRFRERVDRRYSK